MYKKVVCAIDGSKLSEKALEEAIELSKQANTPLTIISVASVQQHPMHAERIPIDKVSEGPPLDKREIFDVMIESEARFHKEILKKAEETCKERGVECRTRLLSGSIASEIINYMDDNQHDLLVMGSRGLGGFKKLLLGSTSNTVIQHCKDSILIVK